MKKMHKKGWLIVLSLLFIVTVAFVLTHYKSYLGKRPCDQPGTVWKSNNGAITFSIDDLGAGTGTINHNGETVDIAVEIGPATGLDVYPLSSVVRDGDIRTISGDARLEHWVGTFKKDSEFTAEVKESTYYDIGDKIHFYRLDASDTQGDKADG